jgi:hypothetical protein
MSEKRKNSPTHFCAVATKNERNSLPENKKIHVSTESLNGILIARISTHFPDEENAPLPRLATKNRLTFCAFGRGVG